MVPNNLNFRKVNEKILEFNSKIREINNIQQIKIDYLINKFK